MWKRLWRKKVKQDIAQTEKVILNQDGSLSLNFKNEEVIERLLASFKDDSEAELRDLKSERARETADAGKKGALTISNYQVTRAQ